MPLRDVQIAAALLATDPGARERLRDCPAGFARATGLSAHEVEGFRALDPARLNSYARSLVRKRVAEARKLLPLTARALGRQFSGAFEAYAAKHALPDHPRYANDAIAFTRFLLEAGLEDSREALVRFESANLAMRLGPGIRFESFTYPIRRLLDAPDGTCKRGWSFALWLRPWRPWSVLRVLS